MRLVLVSEWLQTRQKLAKHGHFLLCSPAKAKLKKAEDALPLFK
jgi:hypothetical protein